MKINISKEVTLDIFKKLEIINTLSSFLNEQFEVYSFGSSVNSINIGIHCADPEFGISRDFETGMTVYNKYVKAKKYLEFHFKLNYSQVKKAHSTDEILSIFEIGLQIALIEVKHLRIKDFKIDNFEVALFRAIDSFKIANYLPPVNLFIYDASKKPSNLPTQWNTLNEDVFWEIIEQSKEESRDYIEQVEILVKKVSGLSEEQIIGYEFVFRTILAKSSNFNVLAISNIIHDGVTDDSFLYLRCRLIAEGRNVYFKAIEDPEKLALLHISELKLGSEKMLYVADLAFVKKVGKSSEKELPRDIAGSYLNYNEGENIVGEIWSAEELRFKYPQLWKKYRV